MKPWATSAAADKLSYLRQQMTWDAGMEGAHVSKGVSSLTFESAAGVCGRIVKSGGRTVPNYEINDYLGSVRVVTGPTGSVLARHDYYATGARMYDPSIARWTVQDPLAEKYLSWSPYVYCVGDPVNYADFDGRDSVYVVDRSRRLDDKGIQGTSYTATLYVVKND